MALLVARTRPPGRGHGGARAPFASARRRADARGGVRRLATEARTCCTSSRSHDAGLVLVEAPTGVRRRVAPPDALVELLDAQPGRRRRGRRSGAARAATGGGVLVPFGGGEHDWAAVELGRVAGHGDRRAAAARGAGRIRGRGTTRAACWPTRRWRCSASSGVAAEPVLVEPSATGLAEAAAGRDRGRGRPLAALAPRGPRRGAPRTASRARGRPVLVGPPRAAAERHRAARGGDALHLVARRRLAGRSHAERRRGRSTPYAPWITRQPARAEQYSGATERAEGRVRRGVAQHVVLDPRIRRQSRVPGRSAACASRRSRKAAVVPRGGHRAAAERERVARPPRRRNGSGSSSAVARVTRSRSALRAFGSGPDRQSERLDDRDVDADRAQVRAHDLARSRRFAGSPQKYRRAVRAGPLPARAAGRGRGPGPSADRRRAARGPATAGGT